ncbi:MAG: hypothetical protein RR482_05785, partial [Clostridia bacterium]
TYRIMPAYISNEMAMNIVFASPDVEGGYAGKALDQKYLASSVYAPFATREYFPPVIYTQEENEEIARISTPIYNAMTEKEVAWIMGQADVEKEYEGFLQELDAMGLGRLVTLQQQAMDRWMAQ